VEVLGLIIFGALAVPAAALAAFLLSFFRLLPAGVPAWLAGLIVWPMLVGGVFLQSYVVEMVRIPARHQAEHLGGQYGTPFNLRHYLGVGFQDFQFEWEYRLRPAEVTALRKRYVERTWPSGQAECVLYQHWDGGDGTLDIVLRGDRLLIRETT
jgi:hypothetical protein